MPEAPPPSASEERRQKTQTMTFSCRRALLRTAHVCFTSDRCEVPTNVTIVQHPYHPSRLYRYRHRHLASLQTWQLSNHHLQVSQTHPFLHRFWASLRRFRHCHQALLQARPMAPSHCRLQGGTHPHPRDHTAACPSASRLLPTTRPAPIAQNSGFRTPAHAAPSSLPPNPSAAVPALASVPAEAQLRDFKKVSTAFVPTSLHRKRAAAGSGVGKVDAAPVLDGTTVRHRMLHTHGRTS
jgi:hypothetical protein